MATTKPANRSGKLRNFFSKLKPNTPAKKLLTFVLIFALLGGGYYAWRSFAATNTVIIDASEMTGGTPIYNEKRTKVLARTLTSQVKFSIRLRGLNQRVCIKAYDINGKTDIAQYGHGVNRTGAGGDFTVNGSGGWVDAFGGTFNGNNNWFTLSVGLHGKNGTNNKTIAVQQVAYIKNGGPCPKDDTFSPVSTLPRQAMAAFLYRAEGSPNVPTVKDKCGTGKPGPFKDVKGSHLFCKEIEWMRASGISSGDAKGNFGPITIVDRQSMAAFLYRAEGKPAVPTADQKCGSGKPGPFKDIKGDHLFCKEIEWMRASGISSGDAKGNYNPAGSTKRQDAAAFLHRLNGSPEPKHTQPLYADVPKTHQFFKAIQWMGEQK